MTQAQLEPAQGPRAIEGPLLLQWSPGVTHLHLAPAFGAVNPGSLRDRDLVPVESGCGQQVVQMATSLGPGLKTLVQGPTWGPTWGQSTECRP